MKNENLDFAVAIFTHFIAGLLVATGHFFVHDLPVWVQVLLLVVLASLIAYLYKIVRKLPVHQEITHLKNELEKMGRYYLLTKEMLELIGQFIKERHKTNLELTEALRKENADENMTAEKAIALLINTDNERREKVSNMFAGLSNMLEKDPFKRPTEVDDANKDEMKVSFYAVGQDPGNPSEEILYPTARYYPNEGEPITKKFNKGQGAAGKAWVEKSIVICENGGEDSNFTEMRPGQKVEYASMICVPAKADLPFFGTNEVYGVLTVDSAIRRGYFQEENRKFWADLLHPLCNTIIYARQYDLIKAVSETIRTVSREDQGVA